MWDGNPTGMKLSWILRAALLAALTCVSVAAQERQEDGDENDMGGRSF